MKKKFMKKRNLIISWVVVWCLMLGWIYLTVANLDFTCYHYTSSTSCSINKNDCTEWKDWQKTCFWIKATKYTRGSSYICGSRWETRATFSKYWTCSQVFTDKVAPTVSEWWIR